MKEFFKVFSVLFMFILLSACAGTKYFTQEMRQNIDKNNLDLNKVQFYNSQKIILKRNLTYKQTKVARGKIKYQNGQYFEEIIIPKNTPGVLEKDTADMLGVAFEKGRNRALQFVLNKGDHYQLSALVWSDGYGRIAYDTLIYYIEPRSAKAMLKVKKDYSFVFKKKIRKLKGQIVNP